MTSRNEARPIYVRLGDTWAAAEPLIEFDFNPMPRRGEAIDLLFGMEKPRTMRVIDIKHSIIDDLAMTELLVWPEDLLS